MQLGSTDSQNKDTGQAYTSRSYPDLVILYEACTYSLPQIISLFVCTKMQKQIWLFAFVTNMHSSNLTSIAITSLQNHLTFLVCGLCHDNKACLLIEVTLVSRLDIYPSCFLAKIQISLVQFGFSRRVSRDLFQVILIKIDIEIVVMGYRRSRTCVWKTTWNINR